MCIMYIQLYINKYAYMHNMHITMLIQDSTNIVNIMFAYATFSNLRVYIYIYINE